ncbi:MAG TPA: hypothetical protein VHF01_04825 [Candidatus Acidoferrum sp.]|nr:hypothetical protein [Candidatus Acidoferrum sp.]
MDVRVLIVLIALFVLFVAVYAVSLRYWPAEHKALDKRHIVTAALVPLTLYLWHGEENRLVRNLEARGYTDVQIEHPDQWHCVRRWSTYSYRARSPRGTPVHGGACIMFFLYDITEPIGEKYRVLARMNGGARVDPAPAERKA